MHWPTFMSSEFNDLKEASTYEEAGELLISSRPVEGVLKFFVESIEDKTWVEKSDGELVRLLFAWMTKELWERRLSLEKAEIAARAIQPNFIHLKDHLIYDLVFVTQEKDYPASSLLFAAQSDHFKDLIAERRSEGNETTTIKLKNISDRFFTFFLEFINTGKMENLWKEEPEEILSVIRNASAYDVEEMSAYAAEVYKRYLSIDNVSEHLIMGEKEDIPALEGECCRFISGRFSGMEIGPVEGEGFELKISNLEDDSIPILQVLAPRMTELTCREDILENEAFLSLVEKMKQLLSVDFSDTSGMGASLINNFPSVRTLKLERCQWMTSENLTDIMSKTPSIIHLSLSGNSHLFIPGTGLLASFNHLSDLDFSYCQQIDDETIDLLASCCPQLISLSVKDCSEITDAGIGEIGRQCRELMALNLSNLLEITSEGIVDLASHSQNISGLNLQGCKSIDERGIKQLFRLLPNLTELKINGTKVSSRMISFFKENHPDIKIS